MARVSRQAVEAFLKDNPDFTKTWFVQHASDDLLQSVLASRSDRDGAGKSYGTYSRNSITGEIFQTLVSGDRASKYVGGAKHAARLKELPESEVFMELIRDIANELDVNVLCHKILTNVSILTGSDRGSLFLARGPKGNRYLVSKLFDVTESSTLEATLHKEVDQIKVPFGVGIAGHVALTKEVINIKDAYSDPRFNQEVDKRTGYKTHSICCTPIVNFDNEVIGVAQIINKKNGNHEFTEQDVVVFKKYLVFCGIGLTNAQLFEISVQEFKRNEMLVKLARNIFQEQTSLERLVQKIMIEAQDMLKCARCCVYITEDSLITDSRHFTWRFIEIAEEKYRVKPVRWAKDVDKGVYRPLQESPQKESEEEADSSPKQDYVRNQYHAIHELLWSTGWTFGRAAAGEGQAAGPKDACRISGSVVVAKAQGNLHIVPGKHVAHLSRHAHVSSGDLSSLNLSHRIDHLSFGDPVPGLVYPLDGDLRITQQPHHLFQYFVQAVPTQVHTRTAHVDTYQLSVTEHDRVLDHSRGSHGSPGILFKYDVDWMLVRVKETRPAWGQLLTRLVGIVGGVFATSGILDRVVCLLCCCWFQRRQHTALPDSLVSVHPAQLG